MPSSFWINQVLDLPRDLRGRRAVRRMRRLAPLIRDRVTFPRVADADQDQLARLGTILAGTSPKSKRTGTGDGDGRARR